MQRDRGRGAAFIAAVASTFIILSTALALIPARAYADSGGEEQQFVARINAFRSQHGLAPVTVDAHLTAVARNWSAHNAAAQQSSHNPNLAGDVGTSNKLGENVGNGDSVDWLEISFEQSPEHQRNLLDPDFRWVGVGVVDTPDVVWVTQDFEADGDTGPSAAPPPQSQPQQQPQQQPTEPAQPTPAPTAPESYEAPPAPTVDDTQPFVDTPVVRTAPPAAATVAPAAPPPPSPDDTNTDAADTLRHALATWTSLTG